MFRLELESLGGKTQSVKLEALRREMIPALMRGINRATAVMEREIKLELSKGGRIPGRTKTQRAKGERWVKNPGVHLRIGTGALRDSWRMVPARAIPGGVEGRVAVSGTGKPYARIHELGGISGSMRGRFMMIARPYIGPALLTRRDEMIRLIIDEMVRPLRAT